MLASSDSLCVICDAALDARRQGERTCGRGDCGLAYRRHLETGKPTCMVCGRPLTAAQEARRQATCDALHCRTESMRKGQRDAPKCEVCRASLPVHRVKVGVCDNEACRGIRAARQASEEKEQKKLRREALRQAVREERDNQAAGEGIDAQGYIVAVVPHTPVPLGPLPDERKQKLREHVEKIVQTAATEPPSLGDAPYSLDELPHDAGDDEQKLIGTACRLCRGHCCFRGEEDAFLTVKSIRDYMLKAPDASPEEIIADYVDRLPEETIVGSCVYHGEFGCVLPREMRSDMCNQWLCRGLHEIRDALAAGAAPQAFIASTEKGKIVAAEFAG